VAGADTLRIDTDAGTQTRLFHFSAARPHRRQLQGDSIASGTRDGLTRWQPAVVTSNVRAGYLRKNGIPYGDVRR